MQQLAHWFRPSARAAGRNRTPYWLISLASVVVLLSIWELAGYLAWIQPLFLPRPSAIAVEAWHLWQKGIFQQDVLDSARRVLIGFGLAAAVAIPIGILMGTVPWIKAVVDPIISIIRPLPALSWIPLSMLWLGLGEAQKYGIVFMGGFAAAVVYVTDATAQVDPVLLRAAKNLGATPVQVMRSVILPATLPSIFSGMRVLLGVAWTCIISAEMVGSTSGLGYRIWNAKDWQNTPQVLVGMVGISLTVLIMDVVFRWLERRVLPWQH